MVFGDIAREPEGWGLSLEGGFMANFGEQLGPVAHGVLTIGVDYQFALFAIGPIVSGFVGWGDRDLSVGGRLGIRLEMFHGFLGLEFTADGRSYDGRALFGPDARFLMDLGVLIHITVGLPCRPGNPSGCPA